MIGVALMVFSVMLDRFMCLFHRFASLAHIGTVHFIKQHEFVPRLILLQNHGIISIGSTIEGVLSAILMADKAARIFVGAAALGGPNFMAQKDVDRITQRPDEHYRQEQLKLGVR